MKRRFRKIQESNERKNSGGRGDVKRKLRQDWKSKEKEEMRRAGLGWTTRVIGGRGEEGRFKGDLLLYKEEEEMLGGGLGRP